LRPRIGASGGISEINENQRTGALPNQLIRVLNVSLFNNLDGIANRILPVAKKLKSSGIETIIVAPAGPGSYARIASRNHRTYQITLRVPREPSDIKSVKADVAWLVDFFRSVVAIIQIIKHESIEIVHVNGLLSLQAAVAARLTGRKLAWHLIGSMYPRILIWFLMPFVKLMATRIILVANGMKRFYLIPDKEAQVGRSVVIHEPVDTDRFDPSKVSDDRVERLKRKFDIPASSKIVGSIGNLTPRKGFEYLIRAAHIVRSKTKSEIRFIIVGTTVPTRASYRTKLVNEITHYGLSQEVILAGWVDDLTGFYAMLDLLALPSTAEGTPLAILEAMSMQIPVVASRVGAVAEQVLNERTGLLIEAKDPNAIASAILRLFSDPKRLMMGKKAREYVISAYSLERCVYEHRRFYSNLLAEAKNDRSTNALRIFDAQLCAPVSCNEEWLS
jgi:glycosyltransferase involved in cell wall biosynthesis